MTIIKKVSAECFHKAKENAENIYNRELSKDECMLLLLGLEYGKTEGYSEGLEYGNKHIKDVLYSITRRNEN